MQALEVASPLIVYTCFMTPSTAIPVDRGHLWRSIDTYCFKKRTRQNLARDTATPEWTFSQLMTAILKLTSNNISCKLCSIAAFLVGSKSSQSNKGYDKGPQTSVFCKEPHTAHQCNTVVDHQR